MQYILQHSFVAFIILEVFIMGIIHCFRLFQECFQLAGMRGLISCTKYLCGALQLDHLPEKSSEFPVGATYD